MYLQINYKSSKRSRALNDFTDTNIITDNETFLDILYDLGSNVYALILNFQI